MPTTYTPKPKTPSYRRRPGYAQALVTLTDAATGKRRDYWLGEYATPESREMYHRVIAAWEANGRRWPEHPRASNNARNSNGPVIVEVIRDFLNWGKTSIDPGELRSYEVALALVRRFFGRTRAAQFGPKMLRTVRDAMIRGDALRDRPRQPWSRKYINVQVQRIRRMFKWAAAQELVPVGVYQSLGTLDPLRRGRSAARETEKVGPAPMQIVEESKLFLSAPLQAVVDLQLRTGARAGELLQLRPIDIEKDQQAGVWQYRPHAHKSAHRNRERVIYFGPRAQEILKPLLEGRPPEAFVFSPVEAEAKRRERIHAARKTPLACGNRPGSNRVEDPKRRPTERYATVAYCRAVARACEKAFPPPPPLAPKAGETRAAWRDRINRENLLPDLRAWRRAHRWHPHQLRHNAATHLRREFGLEAAQIALGHASAQITDAVYAERDYAKVAEIMRKIG